MVNIVGPLRILIADDHQLFRNGVRALIQAHAGWEICGEASTGRESSGQSPRINARYRYSRHQHAGPERRGRGEKNPNGIEETLKF